MKLIRQQTWVVAHGCPEDLTFRVLHNANWLPEDEARCRAAALCEELGQWEPVWETQVDLHALLQRSGG